VFTRPYQSICDVAFSYVLYNNKKHVLLLCHAVPQCSNSRCCRRHFTCVGIRAHAASWIRSRPSRANPHVRAGILLAADLLLCAALSAQHHFHRDTRALRQCRGRDGANSCCGCRRSIFGSSACSSLQFWRVFHRSLLYNCFAVPTKWVCRVAAIPSVHKPAIQRLVWKRHIRCSVSKRLLRSFERFRFWLWSVTFLPKSKYIKN
jgi:hypothetical protein